MVFEKVCEALCSVLVDVDENRITEDTNLQDDLGVDSLDAVELVIVLEDLFDIDIPDEEAEGLRTVGDIVRYIEQRS